MGDDDPTFTELLARRGDGGARPAAPHAADGNRIGEVDAGAVRVALAGILWPAFARSGSPGAGWWILGAVGVRIAGVVVTPDLVGFRRRRGEPRPSGAPVGERPDWVQEIARASPTPGGADGGAAMLELCARARVQHCWIADPRRRTLTGYRWSPDGYVIAAALGPGQRARMEPFEAIEIRADDVFGEPAGSG